jgi:heme/copper-type cytochrome/quinol oxidase subunit 2
MNDDVPVSRVALLAIVATIAALEAGCSDSSETGTREDRSAITTFAPDIPEPYRIEITGSRNGWRVRYPAIDGYFVPADAGLVLREVHIPQETNVVFVLTSADYVYSLALPEFGLKEIAVPDLEFCMALRVDAPGQSTIAGGELCGDPHPQMQGQLVVEPRDDFLAWLQGQNSR